MKPIDQYNFLDEEEFKADLFKKFGVTENPKREQCYQLAYQYGHASGFHEVYAYFGELVDLILP